MPQPCVAVFDVDLPPGIAFVRSLGRAGVPFVAYSSDRFPVGRFSRYTRDVRRCPPVRDTDAFVAFLVDKIESGEIELIAPTSDYVAFNASEAFVRVGRDRAPGLASPAQINDCLFKDRFAAAFDRAGFPTPATEAPRTLGEALAAAERLGYPLVLKPRSHIGVGLSRGVVARHESGLRAAFVPYRLDRHQQVALAADPDVATPIVQAYLDASRTEVVSITGVLADDGTPLAVGHCRKTHQWPPRLGVGTRFEALPEQPFTQKAIAAVQQVLGRGVFELEVLVDTDSGEYWAIDLNPRAFGQIALDVASGRDLPLLWTQGATGAPVAAPSPPSRPPTQWRMGIHYFAGAAVGILKRPNRVRATREAARELVAPVVGPIWSGRDPLPGVIWSLRTLRHPGGLLRPYLRDAEMLRTSSDVETADSGLLSSG